jgi:TPR repeat protein
MSTSPPSDAPDASTQPGSIDVLRASALAGSGSASCRLGDLYREGATVEQDWDAAFRWYSLGAAQGDAHAQNNLGTMCLRGVGCPEDHALAVFWYRKSAVQGHATAQSNLAKRLLRGEGIAPDMPEAFRWFHAASQQGDIVSACEVGTMLRFGRGVARDFVAAAAFHVRAAKGGIVAAEVELGDYLEALQDVALAGDLTASRLLCEMHNFGLGVEENPPLAWTWIKWAQVQGKPADDAGEMAAVEEALVFYEMWLSEQARAEGERVLATLIDPLRGMLSSRRRLLPAIRRGEARSGGGKAGSGGGKKSA